MKRLMILAAMTLAAACGDDSSSSDGTTTTTTRDAGRDAGHDAGRDAGRDTGTSNSSNDAASTSTGDDCDSLTYDAYGEAFMTKYCSQCHAATAKGSARNGAPTDDVYDTLEQIQGSVDEIYSDVKSKKMPWPVGAKNTLSDADRATFLKWLDCGPN